jgi:hypothetical protein
MPHAKIAIHPTEYIEGIHTGPTESVGCHAYLLRMLHNTQVSRRI